MGLVSVKKMQAIEARWFHGPEKPELNRLPLPARLQWYYDNDGPAQHQNPGQFSHMGKPFLLCGWFHSRGWPLQTWEIFPLTWIPLAGRCINKVGWKTQLINLKYPLAEVDCFIWLLELYREKSVRVQVCASVTRHWCNGSRSATRHWSNFPRKSFVTSLKATYAQGSSTLCCHFNRRLWLALCIERQKYNFLVLSSR
jgi:hypothetical protein